MLYAFPSGYNFYPLASPTVGPGGELYGTTYYNSVFELVPPSSAGGAWTETTIYQFSYNYGEPQNPHAGLVTGSNGVLYGTVAYAGDSAACVNYGYGCGAVFSLTPPALPGGVWTEQTLYTFQGGNEDGAVPLTGLAIGKNGELFGTTYAGGPSSTCSGLTYYGASGCGTVFELLPPATAGGAWTESVLYSFTGGSDGGFPNAVTYRDGMLYGTFAFGGDLAACGGVGCGGVCFSSARALRGVAWAETVLYSFIGERDGLFPAAGVTVGKHGELFGTTHARRRFEELPRKPGLRCRVRADATLGSGQSLA